jgi:hypothetical protein
MMKTHEELTARMEELENKMLQKHRERLTSQSLTGELPPEMEKQFEPVNLAIQLAIDFMLEPLEEVRELYAITFEVSDEEAEELHQQTLVYSLTAWHISRMNEHVETT